MLFQFIDGFLPSTGDVIEFLTVEGSTGINFAGMEFSIAGLAPGFLFDIDFSINGLALTALNDGVAVAVPEPLAGCSSSRASASSCYYACNVDAHRWCVRPEEAKVAGNGPVVATIFSPSRPRRSPAV